MMMGMIELTKKEYDESQRTTEKLLVQSWYEVQANVKDEPFSSDYALNLYAMSQYDKFGEKLRKGMTNFNISDYETLEEMSESVLEVKKELEALDKLNYQKLQQTLKYINDIRHKRVRA